VFNNIDEYFLSHKYKDALDMWQNVMGKLRKFLRASGANIKGGNRRRKAKLVKKIREMIARMRWRSWIKRARLRDMLWKRN
jgi:hypothetical protein